MVHLHVCHSPLLAPRGSTSQNLLKGAAPPHTCWASLPEEKLRKQSLVGLTIAFIAAVHLRAITGVYLPSPH